MGPSETLMMRLRNNLDDKLAAAVPLYATPTVGHMALEVFKENRESLGTITFETEQVESCQAVVKLQDQLYHHKLNKSLAAARAIFAPKKNVYERSFPYQRSIPSSGYNTPS